MCCVFLHFLLSTSILLANEAKNSQNSAKSHISRIFLTRSMTVDTLTIPELWLRLFLEFISFWVRSDVVLCFLRNLTRGTVREKRWTCCGKPLTADWCRISYSRLLTCSQFLHAGLRRYLCPCMFGGRWMNFRFSENQENRLDFSYDRYLAKSDFYNVCLPNWVDNPINVIIGCRNSWKQQTLSRPSRRLSGLCWTHKEKVYKYRRLLVREK